MVAEEDWRIEYRRELKKSLLLKHGMVLLFGGSSEFAACCTGIEL